MITKTELINKLQEIKYRQDHHSAGGDYDEHHLEADALLIEYIDDKDVKTAFDDIEKWYE